MSAIIPFQFEAHAVRVQVDDARPCAVRNTRKTHQPLRAGQPRYGRQAQQRKQRRGLTRHIHRATGGGVERQRGQWRSGDDCFGRGRQHICADGLVKQHLSAAVGVDHSAQGYDAGQAGSQGEWLVWRAHGISSTVPFARLSPSATTARKLPS